MRPHLQGFAPPKLSKCSGGFLPGAASKLHNFWQGLGHSRDPGGKRLNWQAWEALPSSRAEGRYRANCQLAWELQV